MDSFKINYYLKKIQGDKAYHYILISVIWDKIVYRTTLNYPIDMKLWDSKKQRVKLSAANPKKINEKLDELRTKLDKFYDEVRHDKKRCPERAEVAELINSIKTDKPIKKKNAPPQEKQKSLLEHYKQFVKDSTDGKRLSGNGKRIQKSTLTSYKTIQKYLEDVLHSSKTEYNFENIGDNFFLEITKYFAKKKLTNNTQGRAIKIIKTFLHYSNQQGLHNNLKFVKALKVFDEESTIVALTQDELFALENLSNLSEKHKNTRDLFIVQIYTGLRFSDLFNLKPVNIDYNAKRITLNMIKTQENIIIPISSKLEEILKTYNGLLPKISSQKYNDRLKEICKLASIDTPIETTKFIGNKRIVETKPKHDMVSSHTARRTFITLTLKKGILPEMVMKVSGHKSRKSFQRYVRITQEEAFSEIQKAWE